MSLRETCLSGPRHLRLHLPDARPPASGWPLLILLDGDWIWPLTPKPAALARCAILMPSHGQQGSQGPQALARRALDFTPSAPTGGYWPDPRSPQWQCGGVDDFLDELLGPMLDWARAQGPLDDTRLSLYGHSYGGLCALVALARRPGAVHHTICASPSLWWRNSLVTRLLDTLRDRALPRPLTLTLLAGTDERWYPQPHNPATALPRRNGTPTLPALTALTERLQDIPHLRCQLVTMDGIGHGEALAAGARHAISLAAC